MLELLNEHFGTEHQSLDEFIADFQNGDLGDLYEGSENKTMALFTFIRSIIKHL